MDASPKYTGVRKRKWGKWVSEIRLPNSRERIWLGSFDSAEKAARAFDAAIYCLRGPGARFNFPENPPEIPGGRSLTPQQIQIVASRFASEEMLSPQRQGNPPSPSEEERVISARAEISSGPTLGQVEEDISSDTSTYWPFLWDDLYFPTQQHDQHSSDFYFDGAVEDDLSHYSINLWNF